VGKPEGRIPLRRPRRRWEENIKMDKGNRVWGCGLDSLGSGYGYVAGTCEHGNEPSGSIKCREILDYLSVLLDSQDGLYSMELFHGLTRNVVTPESYCCVTRAYIENDARYLSLKS
jgi:hypothetical protein